MHISNYPVSFFVSPLNAVSLFLVNMYIAIIATILLFFFLVPTLSGIQ